MELNKFIEMFENGQLHTDFVDRYGCKKFEAAAEAKGVITYAKELAHGPKKKGPGEWHLTRIGVKSPDSDKVLWAATFDENIPDKGTGVTLLGIEYDEREAKDGSMQGNITVNKLVVEGGTAPASPKPTTTGVWSEHKERRIYQAGCWNTAIAKVALMKQLGLVPDDITEPQLNTLLATKFAEITEENPF